MDQEEIVNVAEDLLTRRYGGGQKLHDVTPLSGSGNANVSRARVANNPFLPHRTVVLKHSPITGDKVEDAAFMREVVSYQFTTSLAEEVRPGPVLLAHDFDQRLLVISDSGDGDTFADLLAESDPEKRIQILRNLGTSLGKMHSGTAGKEDAFNILLSRMLRNQGDAKGMQDLRERLLDFGMESGLEVLEKSGFEVPAAVAKEVPRIQDRILHGQFRAFTPFDLSPDNIIVAERTIFLDYEWAGFRDVSFDLACVVGGFPQYLSNRPISDDEAEAFVEAWSREISGVWPSILNEDVLHESITTALIGWALSSVTLMYYGSLSRTLVYSDRAQQTLDLSETEIDYLGVNHESTLQMEHTGELLRPAESGGFSEEELMIRRDLYETFEALSRYAANGRATRYTVVSEFAKSVAERLDDRRAQRQ
ncbi:phosphotransferase family protein [Corynebacterium lubricantis]|uniref:phosphotransferase family protein n=1 Tax=Corynebacterium lubricantis TaxID=541095 RepID=UPI00037E3AED|nr:phosphotransferase [Corynebacterium lubricantis]